MRKLGMVAAFLAAATCGGSDRGEDGSADGIGDGGTATGILSAGGGEKFDVGGGDDDPMSPCIPADGSGPAGEEEEEFSYIWIANSGQGTVSKIDTRKAVEVGRYITSPEPGSLSRTSVNLHGDAAVANRNGSIVKIAARPGRCVDRNGNGHIETSTGRDDVLEWWSDECVVWWNDLPTDEYEGGPRGLAWEPGEVNADDCIESPRVWIGWRDTPNDEVFVWRLDGVNGAALDKVSVPDWESKPWGMGTYGAAANKGGHYWGLANGGFLVFINAKTLKTKRVPHPDEPTFYGLALDAQGDPWMATWEGEVWQWKVGKEKYARMFGALVNGPARFRGIAIDREAQVWVAGNDPCGLVHFDAENGNVVTENVELPGCAEPVGVSIDIDGFVWVPDRDADVAYKVDPMSYEITVVDGLEEPYTYSDMTGAGLGLVFNPPSNEG